MSKRFDWTVLTSYETHDGSLCVDVFRRDDGTFGFEQFRREVEDFNRWERVSYYGEQRFADVDAAIRAARRTLSWFDELMVERQAP
jgi:hypothetical protein